MFNLDEIKNSILGEVQKVGQGFVNNFAPPLVSPRPQQPAQTGSIPYKFNQALNTALMPLTTPPKFNFAQNVQNPIGRVGAEFAQGILNQPANSIAAGARFGDEFNRGTLTPQSALGNAAEVAMTPLMFVGGTGALKTGGEALVKQGLKRAVKQGAIQGIGQGAGFGFLQGLSQNKNASSVPNQLLGSIPSTAQGAALGGVLGGAGAGLANLPMAGKTAFFDMLKSKFPGVPEKELSASAGRYFRGNNGQFATAPVKFIGKTPSENIQIAKGQGTIKINGKEMPRSEFDNAVHSEINNFLQGGYARIPGNEKVQTPQPGLSPETPNVLGENGQFPGGSASLNQDLSSNSFSSNTSRIEQSRPILQDRGLEQRMLEQNQQQLAPSTELSSSNITIPQTTQEGIYKTDPMAQQAADLGNTKLADTIQTPTGLKDPSINNPSLTQQGGFPTGKQGEALLPQQGEQSLRQSIAPQELNVNRLDLNPEQKAHVQSLEAKDVKQVLSNQEIVDLAKRAGFDNKSYSIDQTAKKIAEQLNTRRQVVELENRFTRMQQQGASPEELQQVIKQLADQSRTVREARTEAGRVLQAGNILASDINTPMQKIFQLLDNAGVNPEAYTKEATMVNFNDANQAVAFYRKFVPAKFSEYLDTVRYNSMLSSPLTHISNAFSNLLNGGVVAPVEKTIAGVVDFLNPARILTGGKQTHFAGEGLAHAQGFYSNLSEASHRFAQSIKGDKLSANLDMRNLPLATGKLGKSLDSFSLPTKLLEASDQFFTALTKGGEEASLKYRASKGVNVGNIPAQAESNAAYRLFRSDLHDPRQGTLLNGIDEITGLIMKARGSKNPIISTISKFTLPFVKTPMNILKQGVEYSPLGLGTLPGAADKTAQISKVLFGTTAMAATAMLTASGRTTWAEPTDPKKKAAFRAAGMQPYAVKVGDNWVSYTKLPPAIGFPIAFVSALHDAQENHLLTDSDSHDILSAIAKSGNFFADQSYLKNIGDMVAAAKGSPEKMTNFVSNYPQQLVPYRALLGWMARLTDPYQRQVNKDASFWDKQVQQLFTQVPLLSQTVPARMDNSGSPILNQNPFINAVSPLKVTSENTDQKQLYDLMQQKTLQTRNVNAIKDKMMSGEALPDSFAASAAESNPASNNYVATQKAKLQEEATKTKVGLTGQPQTINNKLIYATDSGGTGSVDLTPAPNKNKESSDYLKWEGGAYKSATKILGLDIPADQKAAYIKQIGLDPNNVSYYDNASQSEDVKTAFVKEHLSSINDHGELLKQLVTYRQEIKGNMVLSDGVISNLVDADIISKEEGQQLKTVKLDENMTPHVKITGRGKGAKIKKISVSNNPIKIKATKLPRIKLKTIAPRFAIPNVSFSTPFDPRVAAPQVPNFQNLIKVKF